MTKTKTDKSKYWTGIAVAAAIAAVLCCAVLLLPRASMNDSQPEAPAEGAIKVSGMAVCLPHKDTSGPQTLECAFGLKDKDGRYYALKDSDPGYKNVSGMPMNVEVTVTGTFTKRSDTKYPTVGIIEVTDVAR